MGFLGGTELLIIFAIVIVLFGARKIPELAHGFGIGIKEFKKATRDSGNQTLTDNTEIEKENKS